jgi:hypothetical protein
LSIDGTTEYLDTLQRDNRHVTVIRIGSRLPHATVWPGKLAMCAAALESIAVRAQPGDLLWQVDADEFFGPEQIRTVVKMFAHNPDKTAAWFFCRYWVGPDRCITTTDCWANDRSHSWLRVWRWVPGCWWAAHEPPVLRDSQGRDLGRVNPFWHQDTDWNDVWFDHYGYALRKQAEQKQIYYGYQGAPEQWDLLQQAELPVTASDYLKWIGDRKCIAQHAPQPRAYLFKEKTP